MEKSHFLHHNPRTNNCLILKIDNCGLKQQYETRLLGMKINDTLTWDTHVDHLSNKLTTTINLLQLCRPFFKWSDYSYFLLSVHFLSFDRWHSQQLGDKNGTLVLRIKRYDNTTSINIPQKELSLTHGEGTTSVVVKPCHQAQN